MRYHRVRESPLLQGFPSCKTVHRTVLQFTLCRAPDARVFRCLRTATRALPSTRHLFLREKGGRKNLLFLVCDGQAPSALRQILIYQQKTAAKTCSSFFDHQCSSTFENERPTCLPSYFAEYVKSVFSISGTPSVIFRRSIIFFSR